MDLARNRHCVYLSDPDKLRDSADSGWARVHLFGRWISCSGFALQLVCNSISGAHIGYLVRLSSQDSEYCGGSDQCPVGNGKSLQSLGIFVLSAGDAASFWLDLAICSPCSRTDIRI